MRWYLLWLTIVAAHASAATTRQPGPWRPAPGIVHLKIWPNGAPDMGTTRRPAETIEVNDTRAALGHVSVAAWDVSEPTLSVYPPRGRNSGAAVIVFPGGGFRAVVLTLEGTEICDWVTAHGITCILSKYRVPASNHYWNKDCNCSVTPPVPLALQDAQRTIRLVRAHAAAWKIDPTRIGVMGFSAGGYLVAQTSNILAPAYRPVDAVDRISSRPDFAVALYPGHLCRDGDRLDPSIKVTGRTPPTFLVQAWDDPVDPICNSTLYARALDEADVPSEVHLFGAGGHAFALRDRSHPVRVWPDLLLAWLKTRAILR